jgi:hypothetical protein
VSRGRQILPEHYCAAAESMTPTTTTVPGKGAVAGERDKDRDRERCCGWGEGQGQGQRNQIKSNQILFVTYTWLADVNASVAKCLCF